ncbi:hypothetical protein [Nocardia sp. BMG51109]|uniref:hypothetical protein n=1 Tax=Nocardia sp. BMG51109 TaxID=1056816 RepID=UPI0012EBC88A|nr:hypothetical protein [Nocardia sp. BMG51109]
MNTQPERSAPDAAAPTHTETIGEIAARMAELGAGAGATGNAPVGAEQGGTRLLPAEAHLLSELCAAYARLTAEVESGRRLRPGM